MSLNLNKVILAGRLTADPELKQTQTGLSVTGFSIAVNRPKSKDGGEQQADFINCVAWRSTAEFIARYFKKGSAICLIGSIQTRSWNDSDGNRRYATEVVVSEASFVESKGEKADSPPVSTSYKPKPDVQYEEMTDDSDLPF